MWARAVQRNAVRPMPIELEEAAWILVAVEDATPRLVVVEVVVAAAVAADAADVAVDAAAAVDDPGARQANRHLCSTEIRGL